MTDPHEDLVEAVARIIRDDHRLPFMTAKRVLALIAERTKDATPEMCNEWGRDWEHEGASPDNDWFHMHRVCALWSKEKP